MNTPLSAGKSAKPAITNYLTYLIREERVEKICFLLAQYACTIPKNLRDVAELPVNI